MAPGSTRPLFTTNRLFTKRRRVMTRSLKLALRTKGLNAKKYVTFCGGQEAGAPLNARNFLLSINVFTISLNNCNYFVVFYNYYSRQELPTSSNLVVDLAGASRNRETIPTTATTVASTITTVNPVERIPESPPPPYVTPPGSVLDNYRICLSRHNVTRKY